MREDRQMCLHHGMNDYISKPFETKELEEILDRQLGEPALSESPLRQKIEVEELDTSSLFRRINGNENLYNKILDIFLRDFSARLTILKQANISRDSVAISEQAHLISGASNWVGLQSLAELAEKLKEASKSKSFERTAGITARLQSNFENWKYSLRLDIEKQARQLEDSTAKCSTR